MESFLFWVADIEIRSLDRLSEIKKNYKDFKSKQDIYSLLRQPMVRQICKKDTLTHLTTIADVAEMESRIKAPLILDIYFYKKNEFGKSREGRVPGIVNSLYNLGLIDCANTLGSVHKQYRKTGLFLNYDEKLRKVLNAKEFDTMIEKYLEKFKKEILKELAILEKRMNEHLDN